MKAKCFIFILLIVSIFTYSQSVKVFTEAEVKQISSYGNGGCLFSPFSKTQEIVNNQIFIIESDQVYFAKINGRINLLSQKKLEGNKIFAENFFFKLTINLDEETKGTVRIIDKNVYGNNKEEVILNTKINRSCGD